MGPEIRSARQTDAAFLAWVILTASRGHLQRGWFDIALSQPESGCLEFLQRLCVTRSPSWWHYSRFLIAEIAGQPVAALSAFRAADAYPLSQAAMEEAAGSLQLSAVERSALWQRGAYIFLCASEADDDGWTLENIATLPGFRRRGVTNALLERALEQGGAQGRSLAQVTYFIGNEAAERAYLRAGFQLADERRHPDFEAVAGTPGVRRVVRPT
jgi:GNAT superfamily N-acetyltransferase